MNVPGGPRTQTKQIPTKCGQKLRRGGDRHKQDPQKLNHSGAVTGYALQLLDNSNQSKGGNGRSAEEYSVNYNCRYDEKLFGFINCLNWGINLF